LAKRKRRIHSISQGKTAAYYLVNYNVRSLVGPAKYHTGFDVVFDLVSQKSYPEERSGSSISAGGIVATCASHPKPWSPHFLGSSGTVCRGSIWQGAQHTLLAHVIIHVARLLNWDEPMDHVYGGWNPKAVEWWRKNLNSRPITSGLQYPSLPRTSRMEHRPVVRDPTGLADRGMTVRVSSVSSTSRMPRARPRL
jgi:hypothetical protein